MFCSSCGEKLKYRAKECGACGAEVKATPATASKAERDPDYGRCEWTAGDKRCRNWGSISRSTNGSGPWYCAGHFFERDPIIAAQIVDESHGDLGLPASAIGRAA